MSRNLEHLRNSINGLREEAADERYYIKPHSLKALCTLEVIMNAVKECPFRPISKRAIVDAIMNQGYVTFSILVHIREEAYMTRFIDCDRLDDKLPMNPMELEDIVPENVAKIFHEKQWEFKPIILAKYKHKRIKDKGILPFKENKRQSNLDGSYGDIFEVKLNASMQEILTPNISPDSDQRESTVTVIRKQIKNNLTSEEFDKEREILRSVEHKNIVGFLCSYTYKGEHSLLFEKEDMNLNDFFKLEERYMDFKWNTTFYTALYGLASALEYFHMHRHGDDNEHSIITGYHHDIRPHNILVRKDTFVLADFGLAKINYGENSKSSEGAYEGGGGDYVAPECKMEGTQIRREADIWSFGAVIVDIASYMEEGPTGKTEAQDRRSRTGKDPNSRTTQFFYIDSPGDRVKLKTEVIDCIKGLQSNPSNMTLRTLLLLSREMLQVNPTQRPGANIVRENAAYIAIKSLFRTALRQLINWAKNLREIGPSDSAREVREDTWNLFAWGEEVGINGAKLINGNESYRNAISSSLKTEQLVQDIQDILIELVRSFDSEVLLSAQAKSRNDIDQIAAHKQADSQRRDKINLCIRKLRRALPPSYRSNILDRKPELYRDASGESLNLPDMPDETLELSAEETSTDYYSPNGTPSMKAPYLPTFPPFDTSENEHGDVEDENQNTNEQLSQSPQDGLSSVAEGKRPVGRGGNSIYSRESSPMSTTGLQQTPAEEPQTTVTTPEAFDHVETTDKSIIKCKPSASSNLEPRLPSPVVSAPSTSQSRGPVLANTGIRADLIFKSEVERNPTINIPCHVHVKANSILCYPKNGQGCVNHQISNSASRYPHIEHPSGDEGSEKRCVCFLGIQTLNVEGRDSMKPHHVFYKFNSQADSDSFRQLVWQKKLVLSVGAKSVEWPSFKAGNISVALWQSFSAPLNLSIVFYVNNGDDVLQHVELTVATSQTKRHYEKNAILLTIDIEPERGKVPAKSQTGSFARNLLGLKKKTNEMKITFDEPRDFSAFRKALSNNASSISSTSSST